MNTIGLECLECRSLDAIALGPTPPELELLAWVEELAAIANGLQDEVEQLKQEAAQLKKTRKCA
jgi:uncharacterized small protein (DUF1192 family)